MSPTDEWAVRAPLIKTGLGEERGRRVEGNMKEGKKGCSLGTQGYVEDEESKERRKKGEAEGMTGGGLGGELLELEVGGGAC